MSKGFEILAVGGKTSLSFEIVDLSKFANFIPCSTHASAAKTPKPPAFVIMAILFDFIIGCVEKICIKSTSSSNVYALIIPASLNTASYIESSPAKAPVCDLTAFFPISVFPDFKAIIGFF